MFHTRVGQKTVVEVGRNRPDALGSRTASGSRNRPFPPIDAAGTLAEALPVDVGRGGASKEPTYPIEVRNGVGRRSVGSTRSAPIGVARRTRDGPPESGAVSADPPGTGRYRRHRGTDCGYPVQRAQPPRRSLWAQGGGDSEEPPPAPSPPPVASDARRRERNANRPVRSIRKRPPERTASGRGCAEAHPIRLAPSEDKARNAGPSI